MKARFVGDPRTYLGSAASDPPSITLDGVTFPFGKDVEVDEKEHAGLLKKLRGNSHFEVGDAKREPIAEPPKAPKPVQRRKS